MCVWYKTKVRIDVLRNKVFQKVKGDLLWDLWVLVWFYSGLGREIDKDKFFCNNWGSALYVHTTSVPQQCVICTSGRSTQVLQVSYLYNWIARDSFTFCSELHAVFVLHIVFIRDVRILSGWLEILFFLAPIGAQLKKC